LSLPSASPLLISFTSLPSFFPPPPLFHYAPSSFDDPPTPLVSLPLLPGPFLLSSPSFLSSFSVLISTLTPLPPPNSLPFFPSFLISSLAHFSHPPSPLSPLPHSYLRPPIPLFLASPSPLPTLPYSIISMTILLPYPSSSTYSLSSFFPPLITTPPFFFFLPPLPFDLYFVPSIFHFFSPIKSYAYSPSSPPFFPFSLTLPFPVHLLTPPPFPPYHPPLYFPYSLSFSHPPYLLFIFPFSFLSLTFSYRAPHLPPSLRLLLFSFSFRPLFFFFPFSSNLPHFCFSFFLSFRLFFTFLVSSYSYLTVVLSFFFQFSSVPLSPLFRSLFFSLHPLLSFHFSRPVKTFFSFPHPLSLPLIASFLVVTPLCLFPLLHVYFSDLPTCFLLFGIGDPPPPFLLRLLLFFSSSPSLFLLPPFSIRAFILFPRFFLTFRSYFFLSSLFFVYVVLIFSPSYLSYVPIYFFQSGTPLSSLLMPLLSHPFFACTFSFFCSHCLLSIFVRFPFKMVVAPCLSPLIRQ